ncbi:MAG: S8 family serine peptidase [Clostridia bacterium]|nr:S8 family serine peptidase [Clostridia bacterium]
MRRFKKLLAKALVVSFMVTSVFSQYGTAFAAQSGSKTVEREKTEILVKYKNDSKSDSLKAAVKNKLKLYKLDTKKRFKHSKIEILEIDSSDDISKAINALKASSDVLFAQPNYKVYTSEEVYDEKFDEQWGLSNKGQLVNWQEGTSGVDVNAVKAWEITKGSSGTVVGVLDTGVDITHDDLKNNIFINPGDVPGNGVDDDGNGYVDDVNGWDFANSDNSVYDSSTSDKHGTHVTGIIASSDDAKGVRGVAPGVKILPLKFINDGIGYTSDAVEAIEYAKQMGVKVINCSFGGPDNNSALREAMGNTDALFICAAGNDGKDTAVTPVYPAGFDLPNIISVAAIDNTGTLASFSNYGGRVSVAAPGVGILSTIPENGYSYISGTSMAASFVSGTAALVKSYLPDMTTSQIADRIKTNITSLESLKGKVTSAGIVNAYKALNTVMNQNDNSSTNTGEDTDPVKAIDNDSVVGTMAAQISPKLQEQIHFGESGVSVSTGNFSRSFTDISIPAPGFKINISRTYNSKDDRATSTMGKGWTFGFEGSLKDDATDATLKVAKLPNGGAQVFVKNTDGTYRANDSRSQLVKQSDGTHILTTKDQYTYSFNSVGYLIWMKDRNGNTVNIDVDSSGKVQKITDPVGRIIKVNYTAQGYITSINTQLNDAAIDRTIDYSYDNNNRLQSVTDSMGYAAYYEYDSQGYLNKIMDSNRYPIDLVIYDHAVGENQHKVIKHTDIYGNTYTYSYNNTERKTTITDTLGRQIFKWYDTAFYVVKSQDPDTRVTTVEYYTDENGVNKYGEEKAITDRNGNKTWYIRDEKGNITAIINPDESFCEYAYDEKNNLIMEKDELGKCTYYVYDSEKKNLLKKVQPLNGTDVYEEQTSDRTRFATTTYTYYSDSEGQQLGYGGKGLQKSVVDPEGNQTSYTYSSYGDIKTVADSEGNITTNGYDIIGQLTKTVSPMGYSTSYYYNKNGLLEKTTLNGGETTRIVYDSNGRKVKEVAPNLYRAEDDTSTYVGDVGYRYTYYASGKVKTVKDPEGNLITYTYDLCGNMTSETKPNGALYTYEYDVMNRVKKIFFKKDSASQSELLKEYSYSVLTDGKTQKTETEYLNNSETAVTTYVYDYEDRLVQQTNPDGTKTSTAYNKNSTINYTTAANGATTYYRYDGLNRLTEKWSQIEPGKYNYSATVYDRTGKVKEEKTGKDKVELFSMPLHDRMIIKYSEYYSDGKLKTVSDTAGRKTVYQYDRDGYLTREDVYTASDAVNTTEYINNHLGKPIKKKVYIKKSDLSGNGLDNAERVALTTDYSYDKNGSLLSATSPDGVTTSYSYDNMGRKTSESELGQDENGSESVIRTTATYNWEGKPLTESDPNGNLTVYAYNQKGLLERVKKVVTNSQGVTIEYITAYDYDRAGRKTLEVSPKNYDSSKSITEMNRVEYSYDKMDRVKTKKDIYKPDQLAQWTTIVSKAYKYDVNGNVIKELDGVGYESGTGTTEDGKISSGYGTEYRYNLANQLVSKLDPVSKDRKLAFTEKYDYDGAGRKISETDGKGAITSYYYDDAGNVTATTVRKSLGDIEQVIKKTTYDLVGNVKTQTDGNGNTTTFEYNAFNKVRKAVYPGDDTIPENTVTFQYDVTGSLMKKQDTMGTVDLYTYDNQGRLLSSTQQKQDGSESITTSTRYDKNGNKRFETDGNGVTRENIYDGLNRLIETKVTATDIKGVKTLHTTKYEYDLNGNQTAEEDWRGNRFENKYDPLNRLIEKKDPYTTIQRLEYNSNHVQTKSFDALGNGKEFIYDKNNRLVSTKDYEGHITRQSYDNAGNIESKTDGNGNVTTYEYDHFDRLVSVTNALGEKTTYTYDLNANMLTQTNGNGHTTTLEYNPANKVVRRIDHGGRTGTPGKYVYTPEKVESYTYNANATMKTKTDRSGKTTVYTYDSHGRMLSQAIDNIKTSYTYDNNNNQLTVTDSTGTTARAYDEMGRALIKTVPNIGTMTFEYDKILEGYPGCTAEVSRDVKGNVKTEVYDKVGRLTAVIADGQTTTYTYDPNGNRQSVVYHDGSKEEYTYTKDNLLKTLKNSKKIAATGTIAEMDFYTYEYDAAHNQVSKYEKINGVEKGTTSYSYDELNRLKNVVEPTGKTTSYTFDKAGNRETETVTQGAVTSVTKYAYNEQNRITFTLEEKTDGSKETVRYTYDNNGNLVYKANEIRKTAIPNELPEFGAFIIGQTSSKNTKLFATAFEYDVWNQLVKSKGTQTIAYGYNGEGRRVTKTVDGKTTRYLYDADKVVLELDGSGKEIARNVYGVNLISRSMGTEKYYYFYNGHADVTALMDSTGEIKATYYYDAFGNPLETTGTVSNPFRYAGYFYDSETGLYYLNARMYDPKTARFLQEDTYRGDPNDPLSLNLYTYCNNEPIMYLDPTGHAPWNQYEVSVKEIKQAKQIQKQVQQRKSTETLKKISTQLPAAARTAEKKNGAPTYEELRQAKKIKEQVNKNLAKKETNTVKDNKVALPKELYNYSKDSKYSNSTQELLIMGSEKYLSSTSKAERDKALTKLNNIRKSYDSGVGKVLDVIGKKMDVVDSFIDEATMAIMVSGVHIPAPAGLLSAEARVNSGIARLEAAKAASGSRLKVNLQLFAEDKGLIKVTSELPGRNGALNQAKRDANILRNQKPDYIDKVKMTGAESRGGHVVKDANGKIIETREYHYTNRFGEEVVIQEHSAPHIGSDGPHFNVRPITDTRNGVFPGTKEHYPFKK